LAHTVTLRGIYLIVNVAPLDPHLESSRLPGRVRVREWFPYDSTIRGYHCSKPSVVIVIVIVMIVIVMMIVMVVISKGMMMILRY
jgi:hypothetical protein